MIWRLTYCNKKGVEARVDIIKGDRTPVEIVKGSANPFILSYKLDKNDRSGHIMTSSADIEFFETEEFNIDKLKTSNETELKVEYFEGNVLTWSGFILPDFFSREIGSPNIVRMTASDRLTALKGVTLNDLPIRVSLRDLIELCLEQTGLSLALVAQIQINQGSTNILDSEILSQRLTDTRGRSISCYDILMSIMVATNSTIRQREGQWVVYNKLEHELRTPTIFFDKVERGAIRTIQPVASSVGVYKEFGGSKTYPENYNFKSGGAGWTVNFPEEMSASFSSNNILGFDILTSGGGYQPVYGTEENNPHVVIYGFRGPLNYLKSENISVPSGYTNEVDIRLDINASAPIWNFGSHQRVSVFAVKGERTQVLTSNGFVDISKSSESEYMHMLQFETGVVFAGELARVSTDSLALSGKLSDPDGLSGYNVHIRLYSSDRAYATIINFASINFAPTGDSPKGDLYKTTQGSNFTKQHDVETTIFGDYITSGLNGYFYKYPIDDTSNLFLPNGELASPAWATIFDTTERPLLHHISRQKSRLFSVAHDILKANINVESFDPLAVFQDCKGSEYVVVSASFDFLRSEVDVELEQIAEDRDILKRDFIYSYFGEGESNIKSIGGIAGGGGSTGGTGGGMTSEQLEMLTNLASWWKLDEDNDAIYSEKSVYSLKEVSAYGLGSGGGGGTGYDRLDVWADYDSSKSGWVLSALLGVDLNTRLSNVESGSATSIVTTGSGNAITSISKSGNVITANKGSKFAELGEDGLILTSQLPSYVDDVLEFATLANFPTTGETGKIYVAIDTNLTYRWTGTTYVEISKSLALGETSSTAYRGDHGLIAYNHSQSEHQTIINGTGFVKANGKTLSYDNTTYEPAFTKNTAFNKNFGTTAGTVAQGNDSRIINGQTAFGWGDHSSAGYALNSALTAHTGNSTIHITSGERTNWDLAYNQRHTHGNKSVIDALTQGHINVLNKLSIDANGDLKIDTNAYATGELSAYGAGAGGGSGPSYERLDSWADYATGKEGWVLSALLGVDLNNRLSNVESGSATSITTTGSGNAITSVSKSGNTLTFTKGSTFSLSGHTHSIAQITGLQGALDLKATQSDIDTAIDNLEIGGRNLLSNNPTNWEQGFFDYATGAETVNAAAIRTKGYIAINSERLTISLGDLDQRAILFFFNLNKDYISRSGWKKADDSYTHIIIVPSEAKYVRVAVGSISLNYPTPSTMSLWKTKLEKGNKATDWTPAPEDQVSDWNTADVTSFSYIKNKPTQLSQFIDNIGVANHIANKANPHNVTTAQIGAVDLTTNQTITGEKTFNANITLGINKYIQGTDNYTGVWNVNDLLWRFGSSKAGSVSNIRSEKVGIGTDSPLYKLDVSGTGRFSSTLSANRIVVTSTSNEKHLEFSRSDYNYITSKGHIGFITGGTGTGSANQQVWIHSNGNTKIGAGSSSVPAYTLDVNGTGRFTGNVNMLGSLNITGTSGYSEGIRIKGVNGISSIWFNAINDSQYDPKMYGLTVDSTGLRFRYGTGSTPSDIASISNTGNITAPTFIGALSGNASSATKLQTARTIAGVSFDGTANIAIPFANLASKPTTLSGYGITDAVQINSSHWANFRYANFPIDKKDEVVNVPGSLKLDGWYGINIGAKSIYGTRLTINGQDSHDKTQLYFNGENGSIQYRKSWWNNTPWTALRTIWDSNNLSPVTTNTAQTITGAKTFTGNVLIKGAAADSPLRVRGIDGYIDSTGLLDNLYLNFVSAKDVVMVMGGGNVGIGTTSPSQKLHVAGNIIATGEVTAYVASDRRLKENIKPITSALDYINRLNPVTYNWNARAKELNSNKPNSLDYGLIAQEVESVLPNIVHGIFDDKYKSIDYIKLIPIMIGAIKELKQEINKLKK